MRRALPLLLLLAALPARGQALSARDSALPSARGSWSVGVFEPLRYAVSERVSVSTHPLLFLVAPNAGVRVALGSLAGFRLAAEGGASLPTLGLRLTQGYLLPSWERSGGKVGLLVVPRAGLRASRGLGEAGLLTLSADVAAGLALTHTDTGALGAPAPLELLLAPALGGVRTRAGLLYEWALRPRLRLRGYADGYHYRAGGSPWSVRAGLGLVLGVGARGRLALGAQWWNSDQHAYDFER
ncbi:MAG TPA: hypothetical protein VFO83_05885, partial [Aggregicoccus sp.]|nr:hypothetical protein [Aggregicoccus sp.]